jgi:YaiO family outer membrane protein
VFAPGGRSHFYKVKLIRMLILCLALLTPGYAQVENVLTQARALSTEGHANQAISLLNEHLSSTPDDSDARVLLGLICSWNKRYDEGRRAFSAVLAADPDYKDAVLGLINLELWSGHSGRAEEIARQSLALRPQDPDYLAALDKVKSEQIATIAATKHRDATAAADSLAWEVGVGESNIFFSDKRSSWHETAVDVAHNFTAGWVTATFSHASWFGEGSNLIDLESYPRIRPGTYGFVDVAFSPDATLYAHHRFGGEIFQNLPHGFEASAGFRYMRFNSNTLLYTGSFGRYFGNYWVLGRTFINPDPATGVSQSYQVSARRYSGDADHYVGLRFGYGASPFEIQSLNDIGIEKSASAAIESLWQFKSGLRLRVTTSVARQTRYLIGALWQYEADCTVYFRH